MIDRFTTALLTPFETAEHLQIPERTMRRRLGQRAAGRPLVHSVPPARRGHPSVPFIAIVEAYVLRSLRKLGLSTDKIRAAATDIRVERFDCRRAAIHQTVRDRRIGFFVIHEKGPPGRKR